MSVLEEVLLEEYDRSLRVSRALESELEELPRGNIRIRSKGSGTYYYLQYRDGSHVRSKYIPLDEIARIRELVTRRREVVEALKEQEKSRRQIERALGRRFVLEHAGT